MNQQMIGKSWLEWENDLPNDSDSAEEEFLEYRQTVKKETPQLTIDHDIKSECGGGYVQTQLMECPVCKKVFKVCHIRDHMIRRHPDTKVKTEPPSNPSMSLPSGSKEVKVKKEYIGLNNNAMVKKRSLSNSSASSPIESVKRPKKDEERSFFFQRRENPTVIFARSDSDDASENDEDTTTHSGLNYINRIIRPLAYPRYGCYTEKNAKMHTYSSASRHLNQKLNLLQTNSIVQDMSRGVNDAKVYIGNLGSDPPSTTEVEKEFSYYGKLQSVWIARRPPGFAYVEFEDGRDARDACKDLDGRTVFGRRIKVEISHGRKRESRRSRSPRGRRSRSPRRRSRSPRRRSRSRSRGRRSRSRSEGRRARRSPSYGGREKSVEKRGSGSPKRRERSRSRSAGSAKSAASKSRSRSRS